MVAGVCGVGEVCVCVWGGMLGGKYLEFCKYPQLRKVEFVLNIVSSWQTVYECLVFS